jgi:hypothetical protein
MFASTVRPPKVEILKSTYPDAKSNLKVVEMADLVLDAGKWPEILHGKRRIYLFHSGLTEVTNYRRCRRGNSYCWPSLPSVDNFRGNI